MTAASPALARSSPARPGCLLCRSAAASVIVPLRPTPPANHLSRTAEEARALPVHPLDLVYCPDCGLVQLGDVVDRAQLFTDYRYATGAVPALVGHFERLAEEVMTRTGLRPGSRVSEIGSNDGTLLTFFARRGMPVLGIDPAVELAAEAAERGVPTRVALFDDTVAAQVVAEYGRSDVVLAANVLAHVRDIDAVVAGIARLLAPDGTAVIEVAHVLPMVAAGIFEFIYHEHTAYYSMHALRYALGRHGLHAVEVDRIGTQGGSLRCWVRHAAAAGEPGPSVARLLDEEERAGVPDGHFLDGYAERVGRVGERLRDVVAGLHATGRTLGGYGASARAVTLLGQSGIGRYLRWIVDDNPRKVGLFTPGDGIPIVDRGPLDRAEADYCVVFAWNYADEVVGNAGPFRAAGGHLVIPFPDLTVV